jgi:Predicted nucleic-acid-binding protein containing a Zn-ribbon
VPVSGRGKVFSFVTFHRVYHPAFEQEVPYVVALVELEEGPRLLTNIVGIAPDKVACEMPVKVVFDDVADGVSVPKFTAA